MKIHILFILLIASIALVLYGVDVLNKSSGADFPESNSAVSSFSSGEGELHFSQQIEGGVDDFCKLVGPRKLPMDLPKDVVIERINEGLSKMIAETTKVFPDEEVSSIESAYYRMIRTVIFMGIRYPEWGVDHGDYFVFSGQPNQPPFPRPSGPTHWLFQGPPTECKLLAAKYPSGC